eukprot:TRINITY_DN491_c0_g1_i1.p1 TRINITY_DN491_c0_g1~~TRINITY_DN491_c0_g1_i1.p1  ORF type:complete len:181 (-),score=9.89 TRINITY_DN491_c0_g1_i1:66-608(-)
MARLQVLTLPPFCSFLLSLSLLLFLSGAHSRPLSASQALLDDETFDQEGARTLLQIPVGDSELSLGVEAAPTKYGTGKIVSGQNGEMHWAVTQQLVNGIQWAMSGMAGGGSGVRALFTPTADPTFPPFSTLPPFTDGIVRQPGPVSIWDLDNFSTRDVLWYNITILGTLWAGFRSGTPTN